MGSRFLVVILISSLASPAYAANRREGMTKISVGVASPDPADLYYDGANPAGMIYQTRFGISAVGIGSSAGVSTLGLGLGAGNKMQTFGFGAGATYSLTNSQITPGAAMAFLIRPVKVALGASAEYNLSSRSLGANIGLLINPDGGLTFGFEMLNITSSSSFGLGIEYDINRRTQFVCDAYVSSGFTNWTLIPGFAAALTETFFFTMSYAFSLSVSGSGSFGASGATAIAKFRFGEKFSLRAGYTGGWFAGLGLVF